MWWRSLWRDCSVCWCWHDDIVGHHSLNFTFIIYWGARAAQWVRSLDLTAHTSLSPIRRGFAPSFVNYKKACTRHAATSDKVYQLLAQGRWFSTGTPTSSTTKTGRYDIAEILLKVALNTKIQNSNLSYIEQMNLTSVYVLTARHLWRDD